MIHLVYNKIMEVNMTIILHGTNSTTLTEKIKKVLTSPYTSNIYTENLDAKSQAIIVVIDQDLSLFQEDILVKIRSSLYTIGIWSQDASSNYLPKKLENLFDSIICEENINKLNSLLEKRNVLLQTPDCSEIEIKDITRVNCQTGKKLK